MRSNPLPRGAVNALAVERGSAREAELAVRTGTLGAQRAARIHRSGTVVLTGLGVIRAHSLPGKAQEVH